MPEALWAVIADLAGADALRGPFRSGRGGRDWVLRHALTAMLTLDLSSAGPDNAWGPRLGIVAQCLATRGTLPTSITLQCVQSDGTPGLLAAVPPALAWEGAGVGVTELTVAFPEGPVWRADQGVTQLLEDIAPRLPSLSSLSLQHCVARLPILTAMPHLTSLSISLQGITYRPRSEDPWDNDYHLYSTAEELFSPLTDNLPAYLIQLHSFSVTITAANDRAGWQIPWQSIFIRPHTTHTLTHLTTNSLHDELLGLLLDCAPELRRMSVGSVQLSHDYTDRKWKVTQVELAPVGSGERVDTTWNRLLRLPRNPGSLVEISGPVVPHCIDEVSPMVCSDVPPPHCLGHVSVLRACVCRHLHRGLHALVRQKSVA